MNWTAAEKEIYEQALLNVEKTNKALARVYLLTQKEISEKLKTFYNTVDPSWSKQYQAQRLSEIFKSINIRLKTLTGLSTEAIEKAYLTQYQNTFNTYAYDLSEYYSSLSVTAESTFTVLPFSQVDESVIKQALNKQIGSYNFKGAMEESTAASREALREAVATSIAQGEGPVKLAKRLEDIFGKQLSRAITTARTEMLKAYSLAQEESVSQAEEMGISFSYLWLGRNDGRERESHIALNNTAPKTYTTSGKPMWKAGLSSGTSPRLLQGKDQAAQNINCRCRRLNVPFQIDESQSFPVINGKPAFREYLDMIEK